MASFYSLTIDTRYDDTNERNCYTKNWMKKVLKMILEHRISLKKGRGTEGSLPHVPTPNHQNQDTRIKLTLKEITRNVGKI
jgi:hypothetical protein